MSRHRDLSKGALMVIGAVLATVLARACTGSSPNSTGSGVPSASETATPTASPGQTTVEPTGQSTPAGQSTPTPRPYSWHSYSWTRGPDVYETPEMPQFGLPIPSGGYFGACDHLRSHAEWPYIGYPFCTSKDGLHWTVSSSAVFKGIYISAVAKGSDGYVMVGGVKSTGQAVVFRSTDASHWTRVPDADVQQKKLTFKLSDTVTQQSLTPMGSMALGPNGYMAAGWQDQWGGAPATPPHAIWHSADGIKWTAVANPPGGGFTRVFAAGGRYFYSAFNITTTPGLTLWYSDDGVTWKRATTVGAGDTEYMVDDIEEGGPSLLIAYLRDYSGNSTSFSSGDGGLTWSEQSLPVGSTCDVPQVQLQDTEYSLDSGRTWLKVETSGPPFYASGGLSFPSCGIKLGDAEFGYTVDSVTADRGLTWIGEP